MIEVRRRLHARPELGFEEHATSRLVATLLEGWGYRVTRGIGGTGVVGTLIYSKGPSLGLRADMDALPIDEATQLPYASQNPGVMHACGHDGHTAMLLAAARILQERRAEFAGVVKLMFQPAEEGGAGAVKMIKDGLLDDPPVNAAFAIHVNHETPTGTMIARGGPLMAGANSFTITVT